MSQDGVTTMRKEKASAHGTTDWTWEENDWEFDGFQSTTQFQVGSWAAHLSDKTGSETQWLHCKWNLLKADCHCSGKHTLANSRQQAAKTSAVFQPFGLSQRRVTPWTDQPPIGTFLSSGILKSLTFLLNLLHLLYYDEMQGLIYVVA